MKLPSSVIEPQEALDQGYKPLTIAYRLPEERKLLDAVQNDLKGVNYVLVGTPTSIEVWRKGMILADGCAIQIPHAPRGTSRPLGV